MIFSLASLVKTKVATDKAAAEELEQRAAQTTAPSQRPVALPDSDSITVLTRKLPNRPILPWNHYDSPWLRVSSAAPKK